MPVYAKNQFRILLVHVPKTGGTSVESALRKFGWTEGLIVHAAVKYLRHFRITPQHYHAEILNEVINWPEIDMAVSLCRHPFDRMKSEYYWQKMVGLIDDISPEDWFHTVTTSYRANASFCDNHIRPQVDFLCQNRDVSVHRLEDGGVEKIIYLACKMAPPNLFQRVGYRGSVWSLRSKKSSIIEEQFIPLRPMIEDFYAIDMEKFGY